MKKEEIGMLWDMYRTLVSEGRPQLTGSFRHDVEAARAHGKEVAALVLAYLDSFLDVALAALNENGKN